YATLLQSDDPAIVIETLNQYRVRERMPDNIGEFTVPLGIPEVMTEGEDITIVSYGATLWKVLEAAESLRDWDVHAEVIDVQTLMPFDISGIIGRSIRKTNRILFVDEDVSGGGSAYMLDQVMN